MRKHTKIILFLATVLFNVLFLKLCGYGSQLQPLTSDAIEPFFGVLMVLLLGLGEVSVIQQFYLRDKYRAYKSRAFDYKLWKQSVALVTFYAFAIVLVASVEYVYGVFYIAVAAVVLSFFWMTGSRTLWTIGNVEVDEEAVGYYLDDLGKLYEVKNVMENDEVVEVLCQAAGDRERTITIIKKKQLLSQ